MLGGGAGGRDADFLLFSVIFGPPPICFPFSVILYFLLFHLSLSELSVSFCVHFQLFSQKSSGIPGGLGEGSGWGEYVN